MSDLMAKNRGGLSLYRIVYALPAAERERLSEGYDLKNFAKVFEDGDMMNTLDCLFDNSLNVSLTSRKMYMHRNTLMYRLNRLKENTGLDLRKFDDAVTFMILHILYCGR